MKRFLAGRSWLILGLLLTVIMVGCAKDEPVPEIDDEAARLEEERFNYRCYLKKFRREVKSLCSNPTH